MPHDYPQWVASGHVRGDECGRWTWTCWAALREAGIGPLMLHAGDRQARSWLQSVGDTLWCESRFDPNARHAPAWQLGTDRGVAQINSHYWPHIRDTQADDPAWAIRFMVRRFAEGNAHWWSCWNASQSASVPSWASRA